MHTFELIRSRRRTLGLEIREGRVIVRAPLFASADAISAFVAAHEDWIARHLARDEARRVAHPEPDAAQQAELIRRAQEELPPLVSRYARIMGLAPARVTITGARTRLGSCSSRGSICFSWRLMDYPADAIEYVVVHELAHMRHMDHGQDFYREIERVLPDYKRRIALLKG
ncbi:MAG: M48 family metallopeptidase [Candidatus Fimadaptatus sp.]